jgi:hypothetical protein
LAGKTLIFEILLVSIQWGVKFWQKSW